VRLLDLLGEVLTPAAPAPLAASPAPERARPGTGLARPRAPAAPQEDARDLWLRTQTGVAPLKRKK
jgi:hypothetical protein